MKFVIALLFTSLFTSCSKGGKDSQEEVNDDRGIPPTISVSSPSNNQKFSAGQTVTIAANVTDDIELQQVHLFVTNKNSNADIVHDMNHVNVKTYQVAKNFVAQSGVSYRIRIQAIDHSNNITTSDIEVSAN